MRTSRTRIVSAIGVSTGAILLSACGSTATIPLERQTNTDVPFNGCDVVACKDVINGAPYEILMPAKWNGTLLLYSHGYRNAQPAPPSFTPVSTKPEPAPGWSSGDKAVGQALLDQGYALAGSAYKSNGWAVSDGVAADEDLHQFFVEKVGAPYRTYIWGDSLGGLITQTLAEKHPEWVSGVAPFCGALAGIVPNLDFALDAAYALKATIYPEMKLTGFTSYEEAVKTWEAAAKALIAAATDTAGGGTAKVLAIAAVLDASPKTKTYDGSTIQSQVKGTVEALLTALGYGTFGRYDVEQRFGGNPSGNENTNYDSRFSPSEVALIDGITPGTTAAVTTALDNGQRVSVDPAALARAQAEGGDPKGTVQDPTITLHTAYDPLVIVQNESFFLKRYINAQAQNKVSSALVQLYTVPPATYPETTGAPYGAGHCNFTAKSRVGVIDLLDQWVREGIYPGTAAIPAALGDNSGYNGLFQPGPWPDGNVQ